MARLGRSLMAPILGALLTTTALAQGAMTDVGTPRSETLIVQTFDGRTANPDAQNPFNLYAIWRGFRELGWSFLWEMDTATGQSYPELADGFPELPGDPVDDARVVRRLLVARLVEHLATAPEAAEDHRTWATETARALLGR